MSILATLWFFLPAGIANAAPVFASKVPLLKDWNTPLDFGKKYRGSEIFGANKRWRGLVAGIVMATVIIGIQKYLFTRNLWVLEHAWFDYRPSNIWLLGPLFGAGALLADAVESFLKRKRGIKPGHSWFPFDQIDYIIGGIIFSLSIVRLPVINYIEVFLVWFGIHLISGYVAFWLELKDQPI